MVCSACWCAARCLLQFRLSGLCRLFGGAHGRLQAKLSRSAALHSRPGPVELGAGGGGFIPGSVAIVLGLICPRFRGQPLVRLRERRLHSAAVLQQARPAGRAGRRGEHAQAFQHNPGFADPAAARLHGKAEFQVLHADGLLHGWGTDKAPRAAMVTVFLPAEAGAKIA